MTMLTKFNERLEELIFDNKINPETLSKASSINLSMIYKYLRNEYTPSTINAIKIADYFNCSLDYLLVKTDKYDYNNQSIISNISIRFKKLLSDKKLSRYQFKKETNIARQSIDDWFNGIRVPAIKNLIIIADFFDCSLDYLVGRSDDQ